MTERRLTLLSAEDDWRNRARCRNEDPNLFACEGRGEKEKRRLVDRAKAICKECVVVDSCLLEALQEDDRYGVRGGLSERQRSKALKNDEAKQIIQELTQEDADTPDRAKLNRIRTLVGAEEVSINPIPLQRQSHDDRAQQILAINNRGGRS